MRPICARKVRWQVVNGGNFLIWAAWTGLPDHSPLLCCSYLVHLTSHGARVFDPCQPVPTCQGESQPLSWIFWGCLWSVSSCHCGTLLHVVAHHKRGPAKLRPHQDGVDSGQVCSGKHLSVRDLVLPFDVEQFSETGCVEVIQLLIKTLVHCPRFADIEECGENDCSVHRQLCLWIDAGVWCQTLACSPPHQWGQCAAKID